MSASGFAALGLAPPLIKILEEVGYEQPSPIQAECIPLLIEGKNLLGTAQTGTGKTAAFALPLLHRLKMEVAPPQLLILTPTRELTIQVAEACKTYARHLSGFAVLPIYGGQDMRLQLRALKRNPQVIVGTPGRILDHLQRKSLNLSALSAVVLDEADEMLRMGFIDDVESILDRTPDDCQRALFSATMPNAVKRIATQFLSDAEEVQIKAKTSTVERIAQFAVTVHNADKAEALTRVLEVEVFDAAVIFVRTKSACGELAEKLSARGFAAEPIHGDLSQAIREQTIGRLKKGEVDVLVATDVAARGLDVQRIGLVLNYDIPYDTEAYVHRVGRTGRAGREGKAILFATPKERRLLREIERATKQPLTPYVLPTAEKISTQRIEQFLQELRSTLDQENISSIRNIIAKFSEEESLELADIAAALGYLVQQDQPLFPSLVELRVFSSDQGAGRREGRSSGRRDRDRGHDRSRDRDRGRDRDGDRGHDRDRKPRKREESDIAMDTFRMEIGRNQGISPKDIVGAIANEADIESRYIGHIGMHDEYSTVDLPQGMPEDLLRHLQKVRIRQHPTQMKKLTAQRRSKPSDSRRDRSSDDRRGPKHPHRDSKKDKRSFSGKKSNRPSVAGDKKPS